jgi:flagellar motility protein MotE (MotC chaperone)
MIRFLQSAWFVALTGCLLYLAVTAAVLNSSTFKGAQFIKPDYSAEDDPSWKFRNPEFNEWLAQIKNEKDSLALRDQQLKEWQARLDAELQEVSTVTQTVAQLQSDFDKNVIRFKDAQADNEKHQAKLLSAMSPEGAIALLNQMPDNDAVRILFLMKADVASQILDTMSKMDEAQAKRAAMLTEKLRQVLPPETTATNP